MTSVRADGRDRQRRRDVLHYLVQARLGAGPDLGAVAALAGARPAESTIERVR